MTGVDDHSGAAGEWQVAALRRWARGLYGCEAAVELLVRAFDGQFTEPGQPWIGSEDRTVWVDFQAIPDHLGCLSGGERRFLLVVASLGGQTVPLDLSDIAYLDADLLGLVLRGLSHASGTRTLFYEDEPTVSQ